MNFNELNQILKYIKKSFPCNSCSNEYMLENIDVLSTYEDQGLFHLECNNCHNNIVIHVTVSDAPTQINKSEQILPENREHRSVKKPRTEKKSTGITVNDVLDMHLFLNNFNGDFKKLFSTKK